MGSRHTLELYDPRLAREQQRLADIHKYGAPPPVMHAPKMPPLSPEVQQKLLDALAKEAKKARTREEERRKRDPTYRPDAMELSNANLLPFDKYVDYYGVLGVDQFASALEIKSAFKKLSLELHPDKIINRGEAERARAKERFVSMTEAHNILSDLATRRTYDQQRDHLDANTEAGIADIGKMEKPPPTCLDVEVTLNQLYRGTRKHMVFERNEFKGTKYHKITRDSFSVKVNRGELEGATVWYRSQGDNGPRGRSDLVFVIKQQPHPVFERLGDDLWYYDRTPIPAERIFYCEWAPTMAATDGDAKHSIHGDFGRVAAVGTTLPALLGYDRSGLGEALVVGHGMPLSPTSAMDDELARDGRTKGDLVVKFPIVMATTPRRIHFVQGGVLPMPPIGLLTPDNHGALNTSAVQLLVQQTVLPHVLMRVARQRDIHAALASSPPPSPPRAHPSDSDDPLPSFLSPSAMPPPLGDHRLQLVAVCLLVGGSEGVRAAPSEAARALMAVIASRLPQFRWHILHMASHVAEPLLDDELLVLESASIVVVEALQDGDGDAAITTTSGGATGAVNDMDTSLNGVFTRVGGGVLHFGGSNMSQAEHVAMVASWSRVEDWVVTHTPGVRVRARARLDSEQVSVLRAGQFVRGTLIAQGAEAWIRLEGQFPGGSLRFVLCISGAGDAFVRPREEETVEVSDEGPRRPSGGASDAALDGMPGARLSTARRLGAAVSQPDDADESEEVKRIVRARDLEEQASLDAEVAEDAAWEAEAPNGRWSTLDEAYLSHGCRSAMELMRHPSALAILRCHCEGGVILAVGHGCELLSHPGLRRLDSNAACGLVLPFLVSTSKASPSLADADGWRRLRGAVLRAEAAECKHGFSAIGLPPGSVLSVLSSREFAVRSILGSAEPSKLTLRKIREVDERRKARLSSLRVERERQRVLREQRSQLAMYGMDAVIAHEREMERTERGAYFDQDFMGYLRGACTRCNVCSSYARVRGLPHASNLFHHCGRCGCPSNDHAQVDTRRKPGAQGSRF